jgi:hypothetical protein
MKNLTLSIIFTLCAFAAMAQAQRVVVDRSPAGMKLTVNGEDFMVNGMNWDYFPIGTNYSYSLWNQPDDIIRAALDAEMSLLKNMGVNTIRVYTGIQPRWITYIYENYGIYTMLNHSFGRYGLTLDGVWVGNTEYADPRTKKLLMEEVSEMANMYKGTPGLLLYLLGNENNYGFSGRVPKRKIFRLKIENRLSGPQPCTNCSMKQQLPCTELINRIPSPYATVTCCFWRSSSKSARTSIFSVPTCTVVCPSAMHFSVWLMN